MRLLRRLHAPRREAADGGAAKASHHLLDQHLRRRGAGRDADADRRPEQAPVDARQARWISDRDGAALALGDLAQPLRVGRVRRADDDHRVDRGGDRASRPPGGWWSRSRCLPCAGAVIAGKRSVSALDDRRRVVDRERRLRDIGEASRGRAAGSASASATVSISGDRAGRQLAHRADHLGVAGMADQHDLAAALEMDLRLACAPW